ncbi:hypothetical protein RI129_005184 [Pyrocoelia pectoralis]|uniref:Reverse transcriptase domain-containing protein n=1 Tax=Pyrocoelia pectoralis TaxID=417401 RepID=A0AAN7VDP8_9COLE
MDEIIKKVRDLKGYKMGDRNVTILCYGHDAVLVAENKDDLQRLCRLNCTAKSFNYQHPKQNNLHIHDKTYNAETRVDTSKTNRILETSEIKVLRRMTGRHYGNRESSEDIRRTCKVENINEWVLHREHEWNEHITRMDEQRTVKAARDMSPIGRRSIGRPRKRWSDNLNANEREA